MGRAIKNISNGRIIFPYVSARPLMMLLYNFCDIILYFQSRRTSEFDVSFFHRNLHLVSRVMNCALEASVLTDFAKLSEKKKYNLRA